jgi:hypothetical protein
MSVNAGNQVSQHPVVGMWKLVSLERESASGSGEIETALEPNGFILYTADGWFAEAFSYRNPDGTSGNVAYCGHYELDGNDRLFHIPSTHANPDLVGARLERGVHVEGHQYTLTAGSGPGSARLVWERLA